MADGQVDVETRVAEGWLRCNLIIEVVGKPKEHVEKSLLLLLKKLKGEKGVEIISGDVHKPKAQGSFFSSFVELDILVKDLPVFTTLCFEYMPSSVEIVEPEHLKIKLHDISDFFNDLLARLHDVDMRFKNTNAANQLLERNLSKLLANFAVLILENGPATPTELSLRTGIAEKELLPFLKQFLQQGIIRENQGAYTKA